MMKCELQNLINYLTVERRGDVFSILIGLNSINFLLICFIDKALGYIYSYIAGVLMIRLAVQPTGT